MEDHKTCRACKNAVLPKKVEIYEWKISFHVCEDQFKSDCFEGAFRGSLTSLLNLSGKNGFFFFREVLSRQFLTQAVSISALVFLIGKKKKKKKRKEKEQEKRNTRALQHVSQGMTRSIVDVRRPRLMVPTHGSLSVCLCLSVCLSLPFC